MIDEKRYRINRAREMCGSGHGVMLILQKIERERENDQLAPADAVYLTLRNSDIAKIRPKLLAGIKFSALCAATLARKATRNNNRLRWFSGSLCMSPCKPSARAIVSSSSTAKVMLQIGKGQDVRTTTGKKLIVQLRNNHWRWQLHEVLLEQ